MDPFEEELLEIDYFNQSSFDEDKDDSCFGSIREVFERAIAQVPPSTSEKLHWTRYIYLWLFYATFEEAVAHNRERALAVLQTALRIVPMVHSLLPNFGATLLNSICVQVISGLLVKAFGQAIGLSTVNGTKKPKPSIFAKYIQMEL